MSKMRIEKWGASWPTLYKATATGKIEQWSIWVQHDGDKGIIFREHGHTDGKLQREEKVISKGKNIGRSNATTPQQQALSDADSMWVKQRDRKHYSEDPTGGESAVKRALAPMLAQDFHKHKAKVNWSEAAAQAKLDGCRALIRKEGGKIQIISRQGKPIETMAHIAESLNAVLRDGDVLDGELYSSDFNFQTNMSLIKRYQRHSQRIHFHAYDTPVAGPFVTRYGALEKLLRKGPSFVDLVETRFIGSEAQLLDFEKECVAEGYEGAMLRHGDAGYESGKRSYSLLKCKSFSESEFLVVGAKQGVGKFAGMAVWACRMPGGRDFDVLAAGTHDEKRSQWQNFRDYIGKPLTVKYFEMTDGDDPVPRFPIAKGFRESGE